MSMFAKNVVSAIFNSFEGEAKALAKARATQDKAIQVAVDVMTLACTVSKAEFMKGNAKTNEARAEVKAIFEGLAKADYISQKSATQYQSCFWIAFETGVPFSRDLVNKKSDNKKSDNKKSETKAEDKTPKAGSVEKTTVPELHKTLSKALAQARILNQTIFAADLVDLITDTWPDFNETVLSK